MSLSSLVWSIALCQRPVAVAVVLPVKYGSAALSIVFGNFSIQLLHTFAYDVAVPVGQHDNRVGSFVDDLDHLLVEHELLTVKSCQKNHRFLKNRRYAAERGTLRGKPNKLLSLEREQLFKQRIRNRDGSGVCLEASLCGDHIGELYRQVNVGHFKRTRKNAARAARAGDIEDRLTGSNGLGEHRAAYLIQTVGVVERNQIDTTHIHIAVNSVVTDDRTVLLNKHVGKVAPALCPAVAAVCQIKCGQGLQGLGEEAVVAIAEGQRGVTLKECLSLCGIHIVELFQTRHIQQFLFVAVSRVLDSVDYISTGRGVVDGNRQIILIPYRLCLALAVGGGVSKGDFVIIGISAGLCCL